MFAVTGKFVAATIERILDAEAAADDDTRRRRLALGNMLRTHVAAADIAAGIRQAGTELSTLATERKGITRTKCSRALGDLPKAAQEFAHSALHLCRHDLLTTVYRSTRYLGETVVDDHFSETEVGQLNVSHMVAPQAINTNEEGMSFAIRFPTEYPVLPERTTLPTLPAGANPPDRADDLGDAQYVIVMKLRLCLLDPTDKPALIAALADAEQAARTVDAARKKLETGMLEEYVLAELFPC